MPAWEQSKAAARGSPPQIAAFLQHQAGAPARDTDAPWWAAYDPTEEARCGSCSFLPLCWGGCPKHHLEDDTQAMQEQCGYWRRNLARYVLGPWVGEVDAPALGEAAQFRRGVAAPPNACGRRG